VTPFAVYVHIPFCTVKCGYCDFNAYAGMDALKPAYTGALLSELVSWEPVLAGQRVASIAFGGGTPGEVSAAAIGDVIMAIADAWGLETGAEVSIEANPGTSNLSYLETLVAGRVTRVSFGAQSFDPAELAFLDRIHSVEAIGASVRNARSAGVRSVGLDLIYGLPGQDVGSWRTNLARAVDLGADHISCYALTVEEGTALAARVARGEVELPGPDEAADLYEEATDLLDAAGYVQYELSNWAAPGHESRHNQSYWTDRPYLGIGAGAHGYLGGVRYENIAHPRAYVAACGPGLAPRRAIDAGGTIAASREPGRAEAMVDYVSLRLRLLAGLDLQEFHARFGVPLADVAGPVIDESVAAGVLATEARRLRLTRAGRLLHGEVTARLIAHIEQR